ncbi:hypothetical protein J5226_00185 [Lysobacter sp. K5869]|uniref:hypothetical protein n=1 Tax=Lysobacter sp. K5869 TaxID=2820808 RepID=UPI001C062FC3|nr:hypothetical protein [Lysobacter sp. K5869]QWP76871.1 hypothetical protein J5226_00185 [Lysobacter sp. K5869]
MPARTLMRHLALAVCLIAIPASANDLLSAKITVTVADTSQAEASEGASWSAQNKCELLGGLVDSVEARAEGAFQINGATMHLARGEAVCLLKRGPW